MTHPNDINDPSFFPHLLGLKAETDAQILSRMRRGEGPARYVAMAMRTADVIHLIWKDPDDPSVYEHGYAKMLDPERPEGRPLREVVFQVEGMQQGYDLAQDFREGRMPRSPDWVLMLRIMDPHGGIGSDGQPATMLVVDTSPQNAQALRALGYPVR
ncbi:MAG: hypothetical protein EOO66_10705 [Methylobacterium sp.]|nr:MAG: hypothetical protein EOO66_10705 [Methylobacterium sp.]